MTGSERVFLEALQTPHKRPFSFVDIIVACCGLLLAFACVALLGFGYSGAGVPQETDPQSNGANAITQDTKTLYAVVQNTAGYYAELPLNEETTLEVTSSLGTNILIVSGGMICCTESDCANQVCVNTGWISQEGELIVCLPHRLTVQVVKDPADAIPLSA